MMTDRLDVCFVSMIVLLGLACVIFFGLSALNIMFIWVGVAAAVLALFISIVFMTRRQYARTSHGSPACCKGPCSSPSCDSCMRSVLCIGNEGHTYSDTNNQNHRTAVERYATPYGDLSLFTAPVNVGPDAMTRATVKSLQRKIHRLFQEAIDMDDEFNCSVLLSKDIQNLTKQSERLTSWIHQNYSPSADETKTMKDAVSMVFRNFRIIKARCICAER